MRAAPPLKLSPLEFTQIPQLSFFIQMSWPPPQLAAPLPPRRPSAGTYVCTNVQVAVSAEGGGGLQVAVAMGYDPLEHTCIQCLCRGVSDHCCLGTAVQFVHRLS